MPYLVLAPLSPPNICIHMYHMCTSFTSAIYTIHTLGRCYNITVNKLNDSHVKRFPENDTPWKSYKEMRAPGNQEGIHFSRDGLSLLSQLSTIWKRVKKQVNRGSREIEYIAFVKHTHQYLVKLKTCSRQV